MMTTIILGGLIGIAVIYIIYKKWKDFKNGKMCGCNCSSCNGSCKK